MSVCRADGSSPALTLATPAEEILSPRRLAMETIGTGKSTGLSAVITAGKTTGLSPVITAGKTTGLSAVITLPRQPDQTGSRGLCLEAEEAGRRLSDWV